MDWKSLLIQSNVIVDLKWISAIMKHMWETYAAAAAFIERFLD